MGFEAHQAVLAVQLQVEVAEVLLQPQERQIET